MTRRSVGTTTEHPRTSRVLHPMRGNATMDETATLVTRPAPALEVVA